MSLFAYAAARRPGRAALFTATSAALLASSAMSLAETISLVSSHDNTLYEDDTGAMSNGAGYYFYSGMNNQELARRGLLQFDLSSVPEGATINSATLSLHLSRSSSGTTPIFLHAVTASWGEGDSDAGDPGGSGGLAGANDATWLHRFYNTTNWTTPGGDFSPTVSATTSVGGVGSYVVPSSAQLVADIQSWLTTPATNFGWAVLGDEGVFGNAKRFDTRENPNASFRPKLTIDYSLAATGATWNVDADGNWSSGSNWSGGAAPNAVGASASFGSIITAPRTVTVDSPKTVGTMSFASPISYSIVGSSVLTFDAASGAAALNVAAGTHGIGAPVTLADDFVISSSAGAGVALSGTVTATGKSITKTGAGTVQFENVRAAALTVSTGTVAISAKSAINSSAGTSLVNSYSVASGAALDLTNNSMVIDYAAASPVQTVRADIAAGRIRTSALLPSGVGLGYGEASAVVPGASSFAGVSFSGDAILIKYTYPGDATLDGKVDIVDLGKLASKWQQTGLWTDGDFNYDGTVNIVDLGLLAAGWQKGVGSPLGTDSGLAAALAALGLPNLGGGPVPEPACVTSVGIAALGAMLKRSRGRRTQPAIAEPESLRRS